ncbi:glycoside hydrolase family 3 C-terminal domain-containing protein, partial [candidate division KSB1 bacterium]|nr:glycoside hydrolase family 3 C-terminal domain-containing protein [candidate division KSB1 bacterium]
RYLKVIATPKHFAVHSGPEPERHGFNALTDERDLQETYLAAFRQCVQEGGAYSIMCAYNRYAGEACCANKHLLTDILRAEWGFQGYVVSDCGAIDDIFQYHQLVRSMPEAAASSVKSGCDLNCGETYQQLGQAVQAGFITETEIDVAVKRLFEARFRLGLFDPPARVPYSQIKYAVVDCDAHRQLALASARASMVLLKNENNLLPLKKDWRTVAVIGPNANDVEVLLGNYNGKPAAAVTPLQGIREKLGSQTQVLYAPGSEWAENLPQLEPVPATVLFQNAPHQNAPGLLGEYFANQQCAGTPELRRIDPQIQFEWWENAPLPEFAPDNFSVRWTGELVPPVSGRYLLGANGFNGFRLYLDGELLVKFNSEHQADKRYQAVELSAGQRYRIQLEYFKYSGASEIQLLWSVPNRNLLTEALAVARQAELIILVLGLSPRLEGEEMAVDVPGFRGGDRLDLNLPAVQEKLMQALAQLGKPMVLVLLNGSALAINWAAAHLPAILEAWYPGQAAGTALADVLFGDYNPGGRLPVTFYQAIDQVPPFEDYTLAGRTYRYFHGAPQFPFGFGLSYTHFKYQNLTLPHQIEPGDAVTISVEVQNIGARAGDEVVQLYLTDVTASVPTPIRSLQGFQRIHLQPGAKQTVTFQLQPRQLSLLNAAFERVIEPGLFEVAVGGKQPGFSGAADANTTEVLTAQFEVSGRVTPVK